MTGKNSRQPERAHLGHEPGQPTLDPGRPLSRGAKCTRCRGQAEIHLPSHHANFCPDCFLHFVRTAVVRGLKEVRFQPRPVMVAVSGGKDSLAVWDLLHHLGYETKGLHINLGIEGFSGASHQAVANFAAPRGLPWAEYHLQDTFGFAIPEVHRLLRGKTCSYCGRLKRAFFNRLTAAEGFDTLVTGHNLDDEAGRLLGNLIGKRLHHVHKQHAYLPSPHPSIPAKLKPLFRLEIKEILAYCAVQGITPVQGSCPFSRGATSHTMKEALDLLEDSMPGTKRSFLFSYLRDKHGDKGLGPQAPQDGAFDEQGDFGICRECGQPAYADQCGICNLKKRLVDKMDQKAQRLK